ncbi:hypothetical protein V8G54_016229, partial [Vigna mungo]
KTSSSSSEVGPTSVPNDTDPRAFQSNHWITSSVTLNRRFGQTSRSKRVEAIITRVDDHRAAFTNIIQPRWGFPHFRWSLPRRRRKPEPPLRGSAVPFLEAEETWFLLRNAVMHRSAAEDEDVEVVV